MRIAVVSPYSWSYPGGVNRHVEELSLALREKGHDVDVLAPWDPDDRLTTVLHQGHQCVVSVRPPWLVPLGRTTRLIANGSQSNICTWYTQTARLRHALRTGDYDVVHVHEPTVPVISWDACAYSRSPTVATFHTFSTSRHARVISNVFGIRRIANKLSARIAVSEAARWTAARFFGGSYSVIPNGVDLAGARREPKTEADHLRVLFVGRAEERKGLPVLLAAYAHVRQAVPITLKIVGTTQEEFEATAQRVGFREREGIEVLGRVSGDELRRGMHEADVMCAPSLGSESFGMVLVESFAAGTPVICSNIRGYADVATHGHDSLVIPPGDPGVLADGLETLWLEPDLRRELGEAARVTAERYAWPRVADEVLEVYDRAVALPGATSAPAHVAEFLGLRPVGGQPKIKPTKDPPPALAPSPAKSTSEPRPEHKRFRLVRRIVLPAVAVAGLVLAAFAVDKVGVDRIADAIIGSSPWWVALAFVLMALAPIARAVAWRAAIQVGLRGGRRVSLRDAISSTLIGILMSATLPARLGEPARAIVMARRVGRPRETLPVVAGAIFSQTILNIMALLVLLVIGVLASERLFEGRWGLVGGIVAVPVVIAVAIVVAPWLVRIAPKPSGGRLERGWKLAHDGLVRLREGMAIFSKPKEGSTALVFQFAAWAMQWLACYFLLIALHMTDRAGLGAAAAVLFAVNVTAAVPITPSNLGVFQAAVVGVLSGAYGVSWVTALAYGILLQAVEMATAVLMGVPAMLREGVGWHDIKAQAVEASPFDLPARRRPKDVHAHRLALRDRLGLTARKIKSDDEAGEHAETVAGRPGSQG